MDATAIDTVALTTAVSSVVETPAAEDSTLATIIITDALPIDEATEAVNEAAQAVSAAIQAVIDAVSTAPAITDVAANTNVTMAAVAAITSTVANAPVETVVGAIGDAVASAPAVTDVTHSDAAAQAIVSIANAVVPGICDNGDIVNAINAAVVSTLQTTTSDANEAVTDTLIDPDKVDVAADPKLEEIAPTQLIEPSDEAYIAESVQVVAERTAALEASGIDKTVGTNSVDYQTIVPEVEKAPESTVQQTEQRKIAVGNTIALQTISDYMVNMAPKKPVSPDVGARHQVSLYRALTSIFNSTNQDESEFGYVFGKVLDMFHEHKNGVFHETHVFRFFAQVNLPDNDRKAFQRILNLIKTTADPKSRQVSLKQIDFGSTLEFGVTENGRQRVLAFYGK